jgi:hypothetical protein
MTLLKAYFRRKVSVQARGASVEIYRSPAALQVVAACKGLLIGSLGPSVVLRMRDAPLQLHEQHRRHDKPDMIQPGACRTGSMKFQNGILKMTTWIPTKLCLSELRAIRSARLHAAAEPLDHLHGATHHRVCLDLRTLRQ